MKRDSVFSFGLLVKGLFDHQAIGDSRHISWQSDLSGALVPEKNTWVKLKKINTGIFNTNRRK